MEELNQGEEYDEYGLEENGVSEDESAEDTGIQTIYGIPKNYVFLGGAVVLVVMIFLVVVVVRMKAKPKEDKIVPGEAVTQETVPNIFAEQDAAVASGNLDSGDDYGFDYSYAEETSYADGYRDSDGLIYCAEYDTWMDDDMWKEYLMSKVSSDEIKQLRLYGYTGDEIDFFIQNKFDTAQMVTDAKQLREEAAKEDLKRMSDFASPEFQYILDYTYLGQPENEFVSQKDLSLSESRFSTGSYTVNADYVKCPPYGTQLYLKVRVAIGTYVWYVVTPQRYDQLPESGNIIVRVNYSEYGPSTFVTGVEEVDKGMVTIDSSASDATLDTMVDTVGTEDEPSTEEQ